MAYTVELRKEHWELIEERILGWELAVAMPAFASDYPYLRLVDPYGRTCFSTFQMIEVVPEIERLAVEKPLSVVRELLQLAYRCRDRTHTFMVFVGD